MSTETTMRLKLFNCVVRMEHKTIERKLWAADSFDCWDKLANEFGNWAVFDIKPVDLALVELEVVK